MKLGTSIKVAFGYVILILLLMVSIFYIYDKLMLLERSEQAEKAITERRRAVNTVVSRLYEAEIVAQYVSIGQIPNSQAYQEAMKSACEAIDSLRTVFTDEGQRLRLDTLKDLLGQKEKNMRSLLHLVSDTKENQAYKSQIKKMIAQQDTVVNQPKIQKKVITNNQSYVVKQKKKKRFFQRLAEAFSPAKEDSTEVNKVVQEVYIDTVQQEAYNAADTLVNILQRAEDSVSLQKSRRTDLIRNRLKEQQASGALLSLKVTQMLETIEQEEQQLLNRRMQREAEIRQKAALTLAIISISAVLLALVFSFIVWRDITQSNHYRKELEKAKKRAEDLLQVRERLMLTITHDIKAPVGSILGYIDLLSRLLKEKRSQFYLENMRSSAQHLLRLVTSLLDFHRLDANKMDIQSVAFNPKQLFETLFTSFVPLAHKKGLEITAELDEALNGSFAGDPFRIRQITDNLLSNALKFTEKGGITLQVKLEEPLMHIAVKDTGCGMSLEEQKKVFQAFTRLTSAQGQEGFGLGLSITQKLVELLGGSIRIGSHVGHGTTFHVYLPLKHEPLHQKADEEMPQMRGKLRVVMIDDDRIQMQLNRAMFESTLGDQKLELTCCLSPEELFEALKKQEYDLLFTDIQMPGMNGFELLKSVRALSGTCGRSIPVVAITARSDMSEQDFVAHGFAASLYKPFNAGELVKTVERVLGMSTGVQVDETPESAPATEPQLDFKNLLAFADGDREASRQILETFVAESTQNVEQMRLALEQEDIRRVGEIAHKMLPSYTMLGAQEVCQVLKVLETKRTMNTMNEEEKEMIRNLMLQIQDIIKQGEREASLVS